MQTRITRAKVGRYGASGRMRKRRRAWRSLIAVESLEPRMLLDAGGVVDDPIVTSLDRADWQDVDGLGTSGWVHVAVTLDEATAGDVEADFQAYEQHLADGKAGDVFEMPDLKLRLVNFDR